MLPFFVFAYDDVTTHRALTQEIIEFFNASYPQQGITSQDTDIMIQGSKDEDAFGRWMRHYYDPMNDKGLVYFGVNWQSSKEWANDSVAQATYKIQDAPEKTMYGTVKDLFSGNTDYSWERAIYEYAWGDKKRGLDSLGHILHLIEDATVPDHTRNDAHPAFGEIIKEKYPNAPEVISSFLKNSDNTDASPYESFAKFDLNSLNIAEELKNKKPIILSSLNEYFNELTRYSNNNFFSRDTISESQYSSPKPISFMDKILSDGRITTFGIGKDNFGNYYLVRLPHKSNWRELITLDNNAEIKLSIQDTDNLILTNYWFRLSNQSILHGAGVIKLFFDEVKKEKETKTLYNKNRSWLGKQIDDFKKGAFGMASILYGSSVTLNDLEDSPVTQSNEIPAVAISQPPVTTPPQEPPKTKPSETPPATALNQEPTPPALAPITPPPSQPQAAALLSSNTSSQLPIAGVSGPPLQQNQNPETTPAPPATPPAENPPAAPQDTIPPPAPTITTPNQDNQTFTADFVNFNGTAEVNSIISQNFSQATITTDANGNWSLALASLPQGTTTIQFFAKDAAGNVSDSAERSIFIDSISPATELLINECASTLAAGQCLITSPTLTLNWSTIANDIDHYIVECESNNAVCSNFNFSNTTATSTTYAIPNSDASYSFRAKAVDKNGNEGAVDSKTAIVVSKPIVINEVAWAGTSSNHSQDEWIELYNNTDSDIDLTGWVLRSKTDNSPYIKLSSVIPAKEFYLLERSKDDNTILDIAANQTYTGALENSPNAEILELSRASTTIDQTTLCSGNYWCGGEASGYYYTLERYDPLASGVDSNNWGTWAGFLENGKNADNQPIKGTPGKRNSINYLISKNQSYLNQDKTLKKSQSPYLITNNFAVNNGATLTIEPNTTIKFFQSASLTINGILKAEGTTVQPIIFTSFKDDLYANDTNQDGNATLPRPGDWNFIKIKAEGSVLNNTVIRYGGIEDLSNDSWASLRIENAVASVKNSVIEEGGVYGIYLKNSSSLIEKNIIRNNNIRNNADSTGIIIEGGSPQILNNDFINNTYGMRITGGASPVVSGNKFEKNYLPVQFGWAYPKFSGNSASANNTNGIELYGSLGQDYSLDADLPYMLQSSSFSVPAGKTLTIQPGAIIKFLNSGISVSGTLKAEGLADKKIIFTSLNDDDCGINGCGDTNATTTLPQPGDWNNITFNAGSSASILNNAIIRYGGVKFPLDPDWGAIKIKNSSLEIRNTVIENNNHAGMWLENSASTTISDSIISDTQTPLNEQGFGLLLTSFSSPIIQNTTFRNNQTHIYKDGTSNYTDGGGNVFE